jgi:hypothetical protein
MKDYLRQRQLPHGVLDRDRHGAQFLAAVVKRAFANETLTDPAKLLSLVGAARSHVVLDLGGHDLTDLIAALRPALRDIITLAMPAWFTPDPQHPLEQDTGAASLFEAIQHDRLGAWAMQHPGAVSTR